jgi:hypothetical protein
LDGDQEELLNKAMEDVENHTRPKVTYEADVIQFAAAGMDAHGVALGDEVQIVDRKFGDAPLRLQARIVEMTVNELDDTDIRLVIGEKNASMESMFKSMRMAIDSAENRAREIQAGGTIVYLQKLLDEINAEINGTGGYTYLVPGIGAVTYDTAVSDPLVGEEASKVVEVRGGSIRIANSRTATGEWDFRSLFDAGHVASEMVVAANMVAGWIQSANGNIRIDLDNGSIDVGHGAMMGGDDLADLINDAARYATDYIRIEQGVGISIGSNAAEIRNVMAYDHQAYVTPAGEVSRYGLNDDGVWEMLIDNISVRDMMRFGNYAWIRRDNGNMTLKWIGG